MATQDVPLLRQIFDSRVAQINADLDAQFAPHADDIEPLDDAIRYALLGGGKRLRPALVHFSCLALGGQAEQARSAAMAIECIHSYSLVHDDLPDMDNDALRRGQPTTHVKFGPATAILAGDALQNEAFALLANCTHLSNAQKVASIQILSHAAGRAGMVGGQQLDINQAADSLEALQTMHQLKTGALIRAACELGAVCANADTASRGAIINYGETLGLLFQVKDDLLDIQSSTAELGKTSGKDSAAGKVTYVSLLGIERAEQTLVQLNQQAKAALKALEPSYALSPLYWIVDHSTHRTR